MWPAYGSKPQYKGRWDCRSLHASSPLAASGSPSSLCTPLPAPASSCPTRIQPRTPTVCGPKWKARLLCSVGVTPWQWKWGGTGYRSKPGCAANAASGCLTPVFSANPEAGFMGKETEERRERAASSRLRRRLSRVGIRGHVCLPHP